MNKGIILGVTMFAAIVALGVYVTQDDVSLFSTISAMNDEAMRADYNQWKVDYNVHVGAAEDDFRFMVYKGNVQMFTAHNRLLGRGYSLGKNKFTALTAAEFAATHLGLNIPVDYVRGPAAEFTEPEGKTTVDWRKQMNAVKDQGQCGSCWAFSAVGAIEGAHSVLKKNLFNLAEQELVDCAGSFGNNGCNGGLMDYAFQYVKSVKGLASESAYPYTAADGTCKTGLKRSGAVTGFTDVAVGKSAALKAALAKQPVSVAIEADMSVFQSYTGGIISSKSCGTNLDHGVVAVGYSDEGQTPYYIVRNSWGSSWGEAGHVRIAIVDGNGICGIQMAASYPTV